MVRAAPFQQVTAQSLVTQALVDRVAEVGEAFFAGFLFDPLHGQRCQKVLSAPLGPRAGGRLRDGRTGQPGGVRKPFTRSLKRLGRS